MATLLIRNAEHIYTCDDADRVIENGYVLVEDGRIVEIGEEPCPHERADEIHDLGGCLVMPGFVSLHHHFFQSMTRAIPMTQRSHALDWLCGGYPLWAELDADTMYWAALVAATELLLTGATTSVDHSYLLPGEDGAVVDAEVAAVREAGLRLHLVRGCLPSVEADLDVRLAPVMGDRLGRLVDGDEAMLFARMERDLARHHDTSRLSMLRLALGPTGVNYDKPDLMRRVADLAAASGCGLHTHYHPREVEREMSREASGRTPIGFLEDVGWLEPTTWFAHCTQLDDEEIAAFAAHGCGVAHCPRTVLRLGYELTRVSEMRRAGVAVGFGVDGPASNDSGGMMDTVRLGLLLHRVATPGDADTASRWLTPYDALLMATRTGARVLGRDDIGHLAPGMAADVTAFDVRRIPYVGGMADPLGGLLMARWDASAAFTAVQGRVLVRDGRLVHLDEPEIVEKGNAAARRMLEQAEASTGLPFRQY